MSQLFAQAPSNSCKILTIKQGEPCLSTNAIQVGKSWILPELNPVNGCRGKCCYRESLSWILVYLDGTFLLEKIWQSNIWLTSQGNYPLNLLPQYFPCWNELIHISWFTQENTVVAKSWKFLHWTRNFFCSTVTMDLPWPLMIFYWECNVCLQVDTNHKDLALTKWYISTYCIWYDRNVTHWFWKMLAANIYASTAPLTKQMLQR